jgi:hypothetical protein
MPRPVAYGGAKQVTNNPLFLYSEQSSVIACDSGGGGVGDSGGKGCIVRQNSSLTTLIKFGSVEEQSSMNTYV